MATYTQNYSLHQWEDTDDFLRTDFNEDFAKIDTALGRAERSATSNAYNIYNLILQNYYESKYTGYKSALLFDGFMDDSQISSMSDELYIGDNALCLMGVATTAPGSDYGSSTVTLSSTRSTPTYTAESGYDITGFTCQLKYTVGSTTTAPTATFYVNGSSKGTATVSTTINGTIKEVYYETSSPISVEAGDTFYASISVSSNTGAYSCSIVTSTTNSLAGYFTIDSIYADTGSMTTPTYDLDVAYTKALAWVHHSGGSVNLTINEVEMTQTDQQETTESNGLACYETAFTLDIDLTDEIALTLDVDRLEEDSITVYDYGIILL